MLELQIATWTHFGPDVRDVWMGCLGMFGIPGWMFGMFGSQNSKTLSFSIGGVRDVRIGDVRDV